MSRVVILSPHFDDAVLSCWSVLTGSHEVEVVNVFTCAPMSGAEPHEGERMTGAGDATARARQRASEDREALALAGIRPQNLDLLEFPHWLAGRSLLQRLTARRPGAPTVPEDRVRDVLRASAAHIDAEAHVYAPAALGAHPDHDVVREAGCRLLRDGVRVSFYADQPYAYAFGWPHWVIDQPPDPYLDVDLEWRRHLGTAGIAFADLETDVVRLEGAHARKLEALRRYRTQYSVLEGGANRRISNPALTGWEVFWHQR